MSQNTIKYLFCKKSDLGFGQCDHINRMITLSVITLSGFYCTTKIRIKPANENFAIIFDFWFVIQNLWNIQIENLNHSIHFWKPLKQLLCRGQAHLQNNLQKKKLFVSSKLFIKEDFALKVLQLEPWVPPVEKHLI